MYWTQYIFVGLLGLTCLPLGEKVIFHKVGTLLDVAELLQLRLHLPLDELVLGCQDWRSIMRTFDPQFGFSGITSFEIAKANTSISHACSVVNTFPSIATLRLEENARFPRQATIAALAFSVGSLLGSFGAKLFGNDHTEYSSILQIQNVNTYHLKQLRKNLFNINKKLNKVEFREDELGLLIAAEHFFLTVQLMSQNIGQLYDQKLPVAILDSSSFDILFQQMKATATKRQLSLPFDSLDQIFQLPTRFHPNISDHSIEIIVDIPLVRDKFNLLHLRERDIISKSQKDMAVFRIQHDRYFLAIKEDRASYVELSDAELTSCVHLGSHSFCRLPYVQRNTSASCLSNLLQGDLSQIVNFCTLHLLDKSWNVVVTDDQLVISSIRNLVLHRQCSNGSISRNILGTEVFPRDRTCVYWSSQFEVPRGIGITVFHLYVSNIDWNWNSIGHTFNFQEMRRMRKELHDAGLVPKTSVKDLPPQYDRYISRKRDHLHLVILISICCLIVFMLCLVCCINVYQRWQHPHLLN